MVRQLIILSLLCFGPIYAQSQQYKWEEVDFPPKKVVRILGGSSENNFLVFDDHGTFYKYKSGLWQTLAVPQKDKYIYYVLQYIDTDRCLIIAVDELWHSHFLILNNGGISKYAIVHKNPFNFFRLVDNYNIYAAGAFGSLAKFDGNSFTLIKTPIQSHIDAFYVEGKNKYWLGTKSDGIFLFDGTNFKKYECEDGKNHEVRTFELKGSALRIITINNETLELQGNLFKHRENDANEYSKKIDKQPTGFLRVSDESTSQKSFNVPLNLKPFLVLRLLNGHILFSNQEGRLFKSIISKTNFFNDLSQYFNINSFLTSKVEGLSLSDISQDGFPDLFISQQANPTKIYLGNKANFFAQKIIQSDSSIQKSSGYVHAIGDINGDNLPDLVTAQHDGEKSTIEIFKGTGNDFERFKTIPIENNFNDRLIENLTLSDFDKDGDLDVIAVYYLGKGSNKGSIVFFENRFWGSWWQKHNKNDNRFDGWNKQVLSADFNNDGTNDIFLINKWGINQLFIFENDDYVNVTKSTFKDTTKTISSSAVSFDFDNDGDLDLLVSSDAPVLQLFENDGTGIFKDESKKIVSPVGAREYLLTWDSDLVVGDYNSDGFLDFFVLLKFSSSTQQYLFINNKGKYFTDRKNDFGLDKYSLLGAVTGDIDDDGDLDIVAYDNSNIRLLINNLDNKNFVKIKLLGFHSSTIAVGSKIYIYKHGHINDKRFLLGYRQIGSFESSKNQHSDITAHFGLADTISYDIVVEFYGGEKISRVNVKAGQSITINEVGAFYGTLINLPGSIFRFFFSREIQFYIISILLSFTVFLFGIKQGVRKLSWDTRSISILSATNISAFWIILIVTSDSLFFLIKYVLPFLVMLIGTIIPLYISFFIQHKSVIGKDITTLKEELLQLSINYSHGMWALTNINGIILLLENLPQNGKQNDKVVSQLIKRLETFVNLTKPNALKLIKTAESIPAFLSESENKLTKQVTRESLTKNIFEINSVSSHTVEMLNYFHLVKRVTSVIKSRITNEFSCKPEEVINMVLELFRVEFEAKGIGVSKEKTYADNYHALISKENLGEIISNCINNSISALEGKRGEITISLKRMDPKLLITISDSGKGIPKEKWEKIFESGYSEKKSTGFGLFHSRELLKKYGGRIFVDESLPLLKTSIAIELNEGIQNEANAIIN
ncbi:MAG: FG-GAP-like repeat-containing protein [Melioribacteraceae bacterium]